VSIEVACDECGEEFDSRHRYCPGCFNTAILSEDLLHRYLLRRSVTPYDDDGTPNSTLLYIMLNPSTADASIDDPTIRKCRGFLERWNQNLDGFNFTAFEVVNLFSFRATKPRDLWLASESVGPECNRHIIEAAARADKVVAAWGAQKNKRVYERARYVQALLPGVPLYSIGEPSQDGHPQHPLMLAYACELQPWSPR
jgi:hypothetical protein